MAYSKLEDIWIDSSDQLYRKTRETFTPLVGVPDDRDFGYVGTLVNDRHTVPTDLNGDNGNYLGAETKLYIYNGLTDVTSEFIITYVASTGVTVDASYFTSNKIVRVTDMTVDAGYVDLTATKGLNSITKRFSIAKTRQGDQAPVYAISTSSQISLINSAGERIPEEITFISTYQVGLNEKQPYPGIFKIYVDSVLWFESESPQSSLVWNGFTPIYPADTLYPQDTLYPMVIFSGDQNLKYMEVQLWDASNSVQLDSETVVFVADWSNYVDDTLAEVPNYTPRYLGRFNQMYPEIYRKGDTWLVYGSADSPYTRGVYYYNGVIAPYRINDLSSPGTAIIAGAFPDILWAVKNGYGETSVYGAVTYIENLITNAIFTNQIQIGQDRITNLVPTIDGINSTLGSLGDMAYEDLVELSKLGSTVIQGGYLKTNLIDVNQLFANDINASNTITGAKIQSEDGYCLISNEAGDEDGYKGVSLSSTVINEASPSGTVLQLTNLYSLFGSKLPSMLWKSFVDGVWSLRAWITHNLGSLIIKNEYRGTSLSIGGTSGHFDFSKSASEYDSGTKAIINADQVNADTNGLRIASTIGRFINGNYTQNAVFDFLSQFIQNTYDVINCNGSFGTTQSRLWIISRAERSSATQIKLWGVQYLYSGEVLSSTPGIYTITDGSSTGMYVDLAV